MSMLAEIGAALGNFAIQERQQHKANQAAGATNKRNIILQMMQNQWQEHMMDKQNEYNKPINQMKRLQEAGLNPNLVYGSGNAIMASASPSGGGVPDQVTPSQARLDVLGAIQAVQNIRNQKAQEKQIDANTDAINANIDLAKARLALQTSQYEQQARDNRDKIKLMAQALGLRREQVNDAKKPKLIRNLEAISSFLDEKLGKLEDIPYYNQWKNFFSSY